jgi:N-acetylglutamate synthase-like GNAT family acetyltransferase
METTNREVRRATIQDVPQLLKLWWQDYPDSKSMGPRFAEFQVVVENGQIIATLGLHVADRQGKIYGEALVDPRRTDEMRALLWPRFQTLIKNFGLFRLWTALPGAFWTNNGFQPADPKVEIPTEFSIAQTPNLMLQLGPEPPKSAKAMGELAMAQEASRGRGKDFLAKAKAFALIAPPVMGLCFFAFRLVIISKVRVPHPQVYAKPAHAPASTSTSAGMQNGLITISNDDPVVDPATNIATATNASAPIQK